MTKKPMHNGAHMSARGLLLIASIGLFSSAALAGPNPSQDALNWMRLRISQQIQRPPYLWSYEQVASFVSPSFAAASRDGKRVTREKREEIAKSAIAQQRTHQMGMFLSADVDARGRIDRESLRGALSRRANDARSWELRNTESAVEAYFRDADANGDNIVSYEEAVRAVDRKAASQRADGASETISSDLDLDGDGDITIEEFEVVIRTVYDEIDANRDARLSQQEVADYQRDIVQRAFRETSARSQFLAALPETKSRAANCAIPTWEKDAILAAVLADEGRIVANIAIGQGDGDLGVINVHIEPGERKLSVVLDSLKPVLWQFTGDVKRVTQVFVAQNKPTVRSRPDNPNGPLNSISAQTERLTGSGLTGISPKLVTFASRLGCLPPDTVRNGEYLSGHLAAALGREPDVVIKPASMTTARLPSGTTVNDGNFPNTIELPSGGRGAPLWATLSRSKYVRPIHVEDTAVVAAQPVRSAPLPGLAGLAAMVDDGRAEIARWNMITRFMFPDGQRGPTFVNGANLTIIGQDGTPTVTKEPSELRILAPIALPPGLEGSGLDRLIIARGVALPSGNRSSICIVREEDAKPIEGSRCH